MKRSIASFFTKLPSSDDGAPSKKPRLSSPPDDTDINLIPPPPSPPPTVHQSYPHPVPSLPSPLLALIDTSSSSFATPRHITKTDLSIAHYHPFFVPPTAKQLYLFLRSALPFYRVTYAIKRGDLSTTVRTPRFTTVYGVDAHSYFSDDDDGQRTLRDSKTRQPVPQGRYRGCACPPRPIPQCLEVLKNAVERSTGDSFNFVLVNYYASSDDSIAYHSDDEAFLGANPTIASLSLGTTRDFLMKHKTDKSLSLKLPLTNGELLVMRGATQRKWLHSIPKRSSTVTAGWTSGGRINITFRKGVELACTQNYYRYNVGTGPVHKWDDARGEMVVSDAVALETSAAPVAATGAAGAPPASQPNPVDAAANFEERKEESEETG